jgi:hypothetical protein
MTSFATFPALPILKGTEGSNPASSSGESSANLTLGRFHGAVSPQDSVYRVCERVFERSARNAGSGGTLEKAAAMANHASTRTTQLYDRRHDEVTLDEVERIVI